MLRYVRKSAGSIALGFVLGVAVVLSQSTILLEGRLREYVEGISRSVTRQEIADREMRRELRRIETPIPWGYDIDEAPHPGAQLPKNF